MNDFTPAAARIWTVFYVVRRCDGCVLHVEKSTDGCTRTIVVR